MVKKGDNEDLQRVRLKELFNVEQRHDYINFDFLAETIYLTSISKQKYKYLLLAYLPANFGLLSK